MRSDELEPGTWWVGEHIHPRQIVESSAKRVVWRYRSQRLGSTAGWATVAISPEAWDAFVLQEGATMVREEPTKPARVGPGMEQPKELEDILRDIPNEAASWIRKHAATIAELPADAARIFAAKLQRGDSAEAEAVIYQSLTREQRTAWNKARLEELTDAVDKRLARKAALAEGVAIAAGIGTTLLASIGGALATAITVGALRVADRISEAGD